MIVLMYSRVSNGLKEQRNSGRSLSRVYSYAMNHSLGMGAAQGLRLTFSVFLGE